MRDDYQGFMQTFESDNTSKVIKSLCAISEYDYTDCTPMDLQQVVLDLKPNSPKSITTIVYVLGLYAKYLGNDDMYHIAKGLDRKALWELAKPNAGKKFISHSTFNKVVKDIELYEEYNGMYISTLFRCLYEGIYSDDMSAIKNLRASDVTEGSVSLNPDNGRKSVLRISDRLASDLVKLGDLSVWERNNRYGKCSIKTQGMYKDSCFKVESRKGSSEYSYRYTYYRILRKVAKDYVGFGLLPLQLFVSGIVYRIELRLEENGMGLADALSDNNRSRMVGSIIAEELDRCAYDVPVRNFREMIKGHVDVFTQ